MIGPFLARDQVSNSFQFSPNWKEFLGNLGQNLVFPAENGPILSNFLQIGKNFVFSLQIDEPCDSYFFLFYWSAR